MGKTYEYDDDRDWEMPKRKPGREDEDDWKYNKQWEEEEEEWDYTSWEEPDEEDDF